MDPSGKNPLIVISLILVLADSYLNAPENSDDIHYGSTPNNEIGMCLIRKGSYKAGKASTFRIDTWGKWKNKKHSPYKKGPHFHLDPFKDSKELMKWHLPQQSKQWLNNFKNKWKR